MSEVRARTMGIGVRCYSGQTSGQLAAASGPRAARNRVRGVLASRLTWFSDLCTPSGNHRSAGEGGGQEQVRCTAGWQLEHAFRAPPRLQARFHLRSRCWR